MKYISKNKIKDKMNRQNIVIIGKFEQRSIHKIKIDSTILKKIFDKRPCDPIESSYNLMVITTDNKILLLQRTQSFHFPKVVEDLKFNKININLLESLYTSELKKIKALLPPTFQCKNSSSKFIHIFPGGHSNHNEKVLLTLLREFKEETTINIDITKLRFNQSFIFKVTILDIRVQKTFKNFIFPTKIDMSSQDILKKFKETKHTRNPTFIDVDNNSLFDMFVKVQKFMLI